MNRRARRAEARKSKPQAPIETPPTATPAPAVELPPQRPSLALRVFARLLLSQWVLKRIHHPDLLAILMQVAQQARRTDIIPALTLKMHKPQAIRKQ
jgi:hypothetical protein